MSGVVQQLFDQAYQRHRQLRQLQTCFHCFGGAIIEAFRERNYRVVGFDTSVGSQVLNFEQPDGDQVTVVLEPYRTQPTFLKAVGAIAELKVTLRQRVPDPDLVAKAQAAQISSGISNFLGGYSMDGVSHRRSEMLERLAASGGHSQFVASMVAQLEEPGNLRFRLQGVEAVASINLILNLNEYAKGALDYDTAQVGQMLDASIYGLEKFIDGMLSRQA